MWYNNSTIPQEVLHSHFLVTLDRLGIPKPPDVLLAHSDSLIQARLAVALCRSGCRVERFSEAEGLLEHLADEFISRGGPGETQVIVADAKLKGRNGCSLLADLRLAGWTTPVVLITRSSGRHLDKMTRQLGLACVFKIPFDIDDLITALYFLVDQAIDTRARRVADRNLREPQQQAHPAGHRPNRLFA